MLRSMIEERGKSVYAVAKESGIPYTTLNELVNGKKKFSECSFKTIHSLATYFGMSVDNLHSLVLGVSPIVSINQTWLLKKKKKYKFPIIKESSFYDASRVHPLKQKLIFELSRLLTEDERIEYSILYGGSTTICCNKDSDIDLGICLKEGYISNDIKNEISEKVQLMCSWNADISWIDEVEKDSKLYLALERGVVIK